MPTVESLTAKRAALHSNLEHLVGQINRTSGAIAVLDELLSELAAEEPLPEFGGIDRTPSPYWNAEAPAAANDSPSLAPKEMLPVSYDAPSEDCA